MDVVLNLLVSDSLPSLPRQTKPIFNETSFKKVFNKESNIDKVDKAENSSLEKDQKTERTKKGQNKDRFEPAIAMPLGFFLQSMYSTKSSDNLSLRTLAESLVEQANDNLGTVLVSLANSDFAGNEKMADLFNELQVSVDRTDLSDTEKIARVEDALLELIFAHQADKNQQLKLKLHPDQLNEAISSGEAIQETEIDLKQVNVVSPTDTALKGKNTASTLQNLFFASDTEIDEFTNGNLVSLTVEEAKKTKNKLGEVIFKISQNSKPESSSWAEKLSTLGQKEAAASVYSLYRKRLEPTDLETMTNVENEVMFMLAEEEIELSQIREENIDSLVLPSDTIKISSKNPTDRTLIVGIEDTKQLEDVFNQRSSKQMAVNEIESDQGMLFLEKSTKSSQYGAETDVNEESFSKFANQLNQTQESLALNTASNNNNFANSEAIVSERFFKLEEIPEVISERINYNKLQTEEIKLHLYPKELGEVRISLSMKDGLLSARFKFENPFTQKTVEEQLPQLKQALESQGLQLGEFSLNSGLNQQQAHFEQLEIAQEFSYLQSLDRDDSFTDTSDNVKIATRYQKDPDSIVDYRV